MKHIISIKIALLALFMTAFFHCHAQTGDVEKTFMKIVEKYENLEDITCLSATKGNGLELIKMMFNKEFGKEFMKGVTSITIIEYSEASEETCRTLHKDLDAFLSLLEEFDVSKEKQFADNDFIRCFASASDNKTISDFVIAVEKDNSKMVMYMAGKIAVD